MGQGLRVDRGIQKGMRTVKLVYGETARNGGIKIKNRITLLCNEWMGRMKD